MLWLKERETKEYSDIMSKLSLLNGELNKLKHEDAIHQIGVLSNLVEDYHAVVKTRFSGSEQTPLSYLNAARTLQKTALQNLTDIVAITHSINTVNVNKLDDNKVNSEEIGNRQRKQHRLLKEQQTRSEDLIEENRKLFNALMDTAVEVANIPSFSDYQRTDTLTRLITLSEIARQSKSRPIQ